MRRTRKSHFWLAGAGAIVVLAVSLPTNSAVLADSKATPPTVETTLGSDGSAVSTRVLNSNGADTSGISGSTALKTSITYELNGQSSNRDQLKGARGPVKVTYKVENTTAKTQDVTYTSADGQQHTQQLPIQVPFVAIVEASVPGSYNNVQATGGAVSAGSDGNLHIIWSLVLFSPIGSPTQEVSFSAQADAPKGLPGVTVTARSINPSSTEGLSGGTLTANAAVAQNDLFGSYATGADQGLTQLRTGLGQLVDGLTKLHDGSAQLALGLSNSACNRADPNNPANPCGIQEGSALLAAGLGKIDAGLAQLADPATGLPSAQVGIAQLQAGVSNPGCNLAAPHDPANPCGLLEGASLINGGVTTIRAGVAGPLLTGVAKEKAGDLCLKVVLDALRVGTTLAFNVPCWGPGGSPGTRPPLAGETGEFFDNLVLQSVQNAIGNAGDPPTAPTLIGGLNAISGGLSNPACNPACGVVQGLDAVSLGLSNPACNTAQPNSPPYCGMSQGLTLVNGGLAKLGAGTATAVTGINALHAGSGQALSGANKLAAGAPTAASGGQQIRDGLAAALAGGQQAAQGSSDISTQGTAPLITKLQDASNNAHLELATIDATGARAGGAPLGADATWLYRLDAVGSGDNGLGGNLLLILGVLVALLIGAAGGFMFGRRGRVTT